MALREEGNVQGGYMIKDLVSTIRENKYDETFRKGETTEAKVLQLTPEKLCLCIEASLTRKEYEIIQKSSKKTLILLFYHSESKTTVIPDINADK